MLSEIDELAQMIDLEVDGIKVPLPMGLGGVMILNLPSYAGGVNLWTTEEMDNFRPQAIHDKIVEVVAITGSFHMVFLQFFWLSW